MEARSVKTTHEVMQSLEADPTIPVVVDHGGYCTVHCSSPETAAAVRELGFEEIPPVNPRHPTCFYIPQAGKEAVINTIRDCL